MTKTQKRKEVVSRFLTFVEDKFPNYFIDDDGFGGYFTLTPEIYEGNLSDNWIQYHRSYFRVDCMNEACDQVKQDVDVMQAELDRIVNELELN